MIESENGQHPIGLSQKRITFEKEKSEPNQTQTQQSNTINGFTIKEQLVFRNMLGKDAWRS